MLYMAAYIYHEKRLRRLLHLPDKKREYLHQFMILFGCLANILVCVLTIVVCFLFSIAKAFKMNPNRCQFQVTLALNISKSSKKQDKAADFVFFTSAPVPVAVERLLIL